MAAIITASLSETDRATEGTVGVWLKIGPLLLAKLHRKLMIVFFKHLRVQWVKFWVICWVAALLSSNEKGSWRPSAPPRGGMAGAGWSSPGSTLLLLSPSFSLAHTAQNKMVQLWLSPPKSSHSMCSCLDLFSLFKDAKN